jgi:DNA polymerase phi
LLTSSVETGALTTAQMKDVFKLVLTAIRQTKRVFKDDAEVGSLWKSDAWDGLLGQLTGSEKYGQATGLHAMCKQVRDATGVSEPRETKKAKKSQEANKSSERPFKSKAKRKAEEVEAPLEKPQKPKKKKRVAAETS